MTFDPEKSVDALAKTIQLTFDQPEERAAMAQGLYEIYEAGYQDGLRVLARAAIVDVAKATLEAGWSREDVEAFLDSWPARCA